MKLSLKFFTMTTVCTSLLFAGCDKDKDKDKDGEKDPLKNALVESVSALSSTIGEMATSSSYTASTSPSAVRLTKVVAPFGDDWDVNENFPDDTATGGTLISTRDWMGQQLDKNARRDNGSGVSMFARLHDSLQIFCALGIALGTEDDAIDPETKYPNNGVYDVEFTSLLIAGMEKACKMEASSMEGSDVKITVANSSGSYDKSITFEVVGGSSTQTYLMRFNGTSTNIATAELNDFGVSRTVIAYDAASKTVRLEYISGPAGDVVGADTHVSAYRMLYDAANKKGHMLSLDLNGPEPMTTTRTIYFLSTRPKTTDQKISLSMVSQYLDNPGETFGACVNADDGEIATDGLTCTATDSSLVGVEVDKDFADTFETEYDGANYDSVSPATTISFTADNIQEVAFSRN